MKKGKNVKNYFDKFEIALIKQYKECRFKVTKVFTIQKGWFGRPYRECNLLWFSLSEFFQDKE